MQHYFCATVNALRKNYVFCFVRLAFKAGDKFPIDYLNKYGNNVKEAELYLSNFGGDMR